MSEWPLLPALCGVLVGCAIPRQMVAATDDLADYRAFRSAEREGTRLERAQRYLESHPQGAWADEVRLAFEGEEAAWFEAAKQSRASARDYVVDLPRGPHARAAQALLVLFDQSESDIDTLQLLAQTRHTAAALELESSQRARFGEVVLEELSGLLDPATWGARLDDLPLSLERAVLGSPRTWLSRIRPTREDELFFDVRNASRIEARVVRLRLGLKLDKSRVVEGRIEGEDLFVRWTEAARARTLDPSDRDDRALAAASVVDILAGAVEARLPASRCSARPKGGEIMVRSCGGWILRAQMGPRATTTDDVSVRGPRLEVRARSE